MESVEMGLLAYESDFEDRIVKEARCMPNA